MRRAMFEQLRRLFQDRGAGLSGRPAPCAKARAGHGDHAARIVRTGRADAIDTRRVVGNGRGQLAQRRTFAELDAARIDPLRPVEIARQWNVRMARMVRRADDVGRPAQQCCDRYLVVGGERHKGRIGAVLEQPPHQIGQEIAVAADRRVGATGELRAILAQLRVQRLAHAVQALEFESAGFVRKLDQCGDRQRVMRGELGENARPQRQQFPRAGDIVQVGHRLAGEQRIVVETALLRALDLGVPIGALDETHHHPPVQRSREAVDIVDHVAGAFLIGLDRKPEAVPAFERCVTERRRDHVKRQFQPVGFLGIDREVQIMGLGPARQFDQTRHQFAHHARLAHRFIARMQRREFDGDAGPVGQRPFTGAAADGFDGASVGIEIARRVTCRARAFAEHVEGISRRRHLVRLRPRQRGFDGFAEHEMAAHQPHRLPCRGAHRRHAQPFGQPSDGALRGFTGLYHACGHPECPGRRVDQKRAGSGLVVHEVALAKLVLDEAIGGTAVRHAQQGFREHHQREALLGRQRELAKHVLDAAERVVIGPDRLDQARGRGVDPLFPHSAEACGFQQPSRDQAIIRRVRRLEFGQRCSVRRHGTT